MVFTTGLSGLGPLLFATLGILTHIAKKSAAFGCRLILPQNDYTVMPIVEETTRALFAGLSAHSIMPLEQRGSAAYGLVLGAEAIEELLEVLGPLAQERLAFGGQGPEFLVPIDEPVLSLRVEGRQAPVSFEELPALGVGEGVPPHAVVARFAGIQVQAVVEVEDRAGLKGFRAPLGLLEFGRLAAAQINIGKKTTDAD
jgi:hypothetical protein